MNYILGSKENSEIFILRRKLLTDTIFHAFQNSQFYQKLYSSYVLENHNIEQTFSSLPTISKTDISKNPESILTSNSFPHRIGFSSGTTWKNKNSTTFSRTYTSKNEEFALQEYLQIVKNEISSPLPLSIRLINSVHGSNEGLGLPGTFLVPLEREFNFHHLLKLLNQEFQFDGYQKKISVIAGTLSSLKLLCTLILNEEQSIKNLKNIQTIISYAGALSPHSKSVIERLLNGKVLDVYGISEISAAVGYKNEQSNGYQLPPIVIPEILNIRDDNKATDGIGELVLTSLFPFTQLQPLIRYRTGDLVVQSKGSQDYNNLSFNVLGRITNCLIDSSGNIILPSSILYNILEEIPEVAKDSLTPIKKFGLNDPFGVPKFKLELIENSNSYSVLIDIELSFHPFLFLNKEEEIRKDISRNLYKGIEPYIKKTIFEKITFIINLKAPGSNLPSDL